MGGSHNRDAVYLQAYRNIKENIVVHAAADEDDDDNDDDDNDDDDNDDDNNDDDNSTHHQQEVIDHELATLVSESAPSNSRDAATKLVVWRGQLHAKWTGRAVQGDRAAIRSRDGWYVNCQRLSLRINKVIHILFSEYGK